MVCISLQCQQGGLLTLRHLPELFLPLICSSCLLQVQTAKSHTTPPPFPPPLLTLMTFVIPGINTTGRRAWICSSVSCKSLCKLDVFWSMHDPFWLLTCVQSLQVINTSLRK